MDPTTRLIVILAASVAVILLAAWVVIRVRRWRRRSPEEIERLRRLDINVRGRIAAGQILDFTEPEPGKPGLRLVIYKYDIAGVTYEAAQDICALPAVVALVRRRIGRIASVKFDPRVPANSILACEQWSGIPEADHKTSSNKQPVPAPAGAAEKL
jgi:hypothetical protein